MYAEVRGDARVIKNASEAPEEAGTARFSNFTTLKLTKLFGYFGHVKVKELVVR